MTKTSISQLVLTHANGVQRAHSERLQVRPPLLAALAVLVLSAAGCADTYGGPQGEAAPSDGMELAHDEELTSRPIVGGLKNKRAIVAEANLPGRTIQFIEPEPGVLIELETGNAAEVSRAPEQAFLDAELSSVERYERLTGLAAPEELLRAQELVDEVRLRAHAEGGRPSIVEPAQPRASEPHGGNKAKYGPAPAGRSWFLDNYCKPTNRYKFWFGAGGDTSLVQDNVNFLRSGAYSILGTINFVVAYTGTVSNNEKLDVWIGEGQYAALHANSHVNATFGSSVWDADGDLYDHCMNYHF